MEGDWWVLLTVPLVLSLNPHFLSSWLDRVLLPSWEIKGIPNAALPTNRASYNFHFPLPYARPLWCPVPPSVPFGRLVERDWRRQVLLGSVGGVVWR